MWSYGLTAYPSGEEVGAPVQGRLDLHDHESSFKNGEARNRHVVPSARARR